MIVAEFSEEKNLMDTENGLVAAYALDGVGGGKALMCWWHSRCGYLNAGAGFESGCSRCFDSFLKQSFSHKQLTLNDVQNICACIFTAFTDELPFLREFISHRKGIEGFHQPEAITDI